VFDFSFFNSIFHLRFGEIAAYLPSGGDERNIVVVIERNPIANQSETPGVLSRPMLVHIPNSSATQGFTADLTATGISSTELNVGRDKLRLAVRVGTTATEVSIRRIVAQDESVLTLEVA